MTRLVVVIVLLACSSPVEQPLTPFQIPAWTSMPSDDEVVRAIVGTAGSETRRAEAEAITRDLLLPRLRRDTGKDLAKLQWMLQALVSSYETFHREALGDEFLRHAVFHEVGDLGARADRLAVVRLKHALWPSEPFPETWENDTVIDPATVDGAAAAVHHRMLEVEGRYRDRLPVVLGRAAVELDNPEYGGHRTVELARNKIHIAHTGDYSVTAGHFYSELTKRGVNTRRHPDDRPY